MNLLMAKHDPVLVFLSAILIHFQIVSRSCSGGMVLWDVANTDWCCRISSLDLSIGLIHLSRYLVHRHDELSAHCRTYMK